MIILTIVRGVCGVAISEKYLQYFDNKKYIFYYANLVYNESD